MSRCNHSPKVRRRRRWYENVGDPNDKNFGRKNPNDIPRETKAKVKEN